MKTLVALALICVAPMAAANNTAAAIGQLTLIVRMLFELLALFGFLAFTWHAFTGLKELRNPHRLITKRECYKRILSWILCCIVIAVSFYFYQKNGSGEIMIFETFNDTRGS